MTTYVFDGTMDGLLTAVFDAFSLKEEPQERCIAAVLQPYLSSDDGR